ncbi:MAG: sigma-54-dependent Fis family transcriptional regulator [Deltaproteobacteria bacterium]|nr:sigma-54-dependent Fis family transcriptional regulator [Deltaproteobacteria bacterium]
MTYSMDFDLLSDISGHFDIERAITHTEALWQQLLTQRSMPQQDLRPTILNSWQRCLDLEVNPHRNTPPQLSVREIENRLQTRKEYLDVIQPIVAGMERIADLSRFIIAFADREGFLLMIYGNRQLKQEMDKLNSRVGNNMSERYAGTNAIGIALTTGQPSQVFHAEHFCQGLHNYSCIAIPIRDPFSQEIIGVLDFVSRVEDHQPHIFGMAAQMGRCIELEIYREEKEREDLFREQILDQMEGGIIVLNDDDRISQVNLKALDYLNVERKSILNKRLQDFDILSGWKDMEEPFWLSRDQNTEIFLKRRPIVHQQRTLGSFIFCEPIKKASKQVTSQKNTSIRRPIGRSPAFRDVLHVAEHTAQFNSNILISGETGTGKEVLARFIHRKSRRHDKPFVAVNCGSIPRELLGSELFGYKAGAFTGASKKGHISKFELANGGTLLLDEISEMPIESQVYLLRVIEEKVLTPLGGTQQIPVDVRIIAVSNKDLYKEVKAGRFRDDLFFRLNVVHINMPLLKERKEDIPLLVKHFIEDLSQSLLKRVEGLSPGIVDALMAYEWPGNVRELKNALEHAMVICPGEMITWEVLPEKIRNGGSVPDHLPEQERGRYLRFVRAFQESKGNITQAAKLLNVSRPTVYAWRKKFGLN